MTDDIGTLQIKAQNALGVEGYKKLADAITADLQARLKEAKQAESYIANQRAWDRVKELERQLEGMKKMHEYNLESAKKIAEKQAQQQPPAVGGRTAPTEHPQPRCGSVEGSGDGITPKDIQEYYKGDISDLGRNVMPIAVDVANWAFERGKQAAVEHLICPTCSKRVCEDVNHHRQTCQSEELSKDVIDLLCQLAHRHQDGTYGNPESTKKDESLADRAWAQLVKYKATHHQNPRAAQGKEIKKESD